MEDLQIFPNYTAFLPGVKAAVVIDNSRDMFAKPDAMPYDVETEKKAVKVVPWGEDNDLPQQIIQKVGKSPDVSTGLLFNIQVGYGDGVVPCRYEIDKEGKKKVIPVYDNVEINDFFEKNDINGYLLEQLTDINHFYNVFPEIILNRDKSNARKAVELNHKEAAFSRWSKMDKKTGKIPYHLYSAQWGVKKTPEKDEIEITPVLDFKRPVMDILRRIGREKYPDGRIKDEKQYRYIVPVTFPTPGRSYYQKPYWYSIIESGWYDFATSIPEFKKYLIKNGMALRYIIYMSDQYFTDIFAQEGITSEKAKKDRIKKEYKDLNDFITGIENTGKTMVSIFKETVVGDKKYRIEIKPLENQQKGGEYSQDSGEVSNMIAYTLGVHPSLIGATPGKNGSLSGSDKRELFIIKQALLKSIRDRLLRPLYLIKKVNKWPEGIYFTIPNIELTTLDKNKTGVQTKIG